MAEEAIKTCYYKDKSHLIIECEDGIKYREFIDEHEYRFIGVSGSTEYIFTLDEYVEVEDRTWENLLQMTGGKYRKNSYSRSIVGEPSLYLMFEDYENGEVRHFGNYRIELSRPILVETKIHDTVEEITLCDLADLNKHNKHYKTGLWSDSYADGNRYNYMWTDDKKNGWATHKGPDGSITEYLYENDVLIGERTSNRCTIPEEKLAAFGPRIFAA